MATLHIHTYTYALLKEVAFGKEWVDDGLEDGDEHQDQDGVEGLHLVGLDGHFTQPPVHPHGLQRPARALRRRGKGEEHSGISLSSVTVLHDTSSKQ